MRPCLSNDKTILKNSNLFTNAPGDTNPIRISKVCCMFIATGHWMKLQQKIIPVIQDSVYTLQSSSKTR